MSLHKHERINKTLEADSQKVSLTGEQLLRIAELEGNIQHWHTILDVMQEAHTQGKAINPVDSNDAYAISLLIQTAETEKKKLLRSANSGRLARFLLRKER